MAGLKRAVIFSRDNLVAGTLGNLLAFRGVSVLAVSTTANAGLTFPHLTLPRLNTPIVDPQTAPHEQHRDSGGEQAMLDQFFEARGNPDSILQSDLGNHLVTLGLSQKKRVSFYKRIASTSYKFAQVGTQIRLVKTINSGGSPL